MDTSVFDEELVGLREIFGPDLIGTLLRTFVFDDWQREALKEVNNETLPFVHQLRLDPKKVGISMGNLLNQSTVHVWLECEIGADYPSSNGLSVVITRPRGLQPAQMLELERKLREVVWICWSLLLIQIVVQSESMTGQPRIYFLVEEAVQYLRDHGM